MAEVLQRRVETHGLNAPHFAMAESPWLWPVWEPLLALVLKRSWRTLACCIKDNFASRMQVRPSGLAPPAPSLVSGGIAALGEESLFAPSRFDMLGMPCRLGHLFMNAGSSDGAAFTSPAF